MRLFKSWIWPFPSHKQAKHGLNQRNIARNGIGMQKTIRNDVSHIKFEQIVQKLYTQDICGGHLGFSLFVHFSRIIYKVAHLGWAIEYIYILNHASDIKLQWFICGFVFLKRSQNAVFVVVF